MAYAVVVSLKQTLEPLLDPGRSRIQIPNSELKLIHDDLCYLKSFFDKVKSLEDNNSVEEVEKEIKEVVQNSQDLIETHLSDLVYSGDESSISGFSRELVEVREKLGSLTKILKAKEAYLTGDQPLVPAGFGRNNKIVGLADADVSSRIDFGRNNKTVGLKDELMRLLELLIGERSDLNVISIVGMGGVGKTTLAKEVWDILRRFLPADENGSKIILTTRMSGLAHGACDSKNILQMRCLSIAYSWELLCEMAFSDMMACPPELEEIGKTIVKKLGGLPLAIVVIGKLLSKSARTAENWMAVAQNILTYPGNNHPNACFLYLGLFPPNYNIPTSQLIKLWVAEGFFQPVAEKSLEQKAEEYLVDLVSRSLVIVHELSSSGRIKTCRIHQLFQDICVSAAQQEKLFHIVNEGTTEGTRNQRRLGIQSDVFGVLGPLVSSVRSLVFFCPQHQHPLQPQVYRRYRWLRVLLAVSTRFWEFPHEVVELVRLRYLAITYHGELPSSISRLWNLEVLIIHPTDPTTNSSVFLPLEIWKLHKLRHLQCMGYDLLDPSDAAAAAATGCGHSLFLQKLQTLSGVSARTCTEGVLGRMPNLIKLGILLEPTDHAVEISSCFDAVLTNLHYLESFKCAAMNRGLQSEAAFSLSGFPTRLRKLSLGGCGFRWDEHMTIMYQLPLLQVLNLRWHSFCGPDWCISEEGVFPRLKFLALEDLDIEQFIIESSYHFPCLEQLLIRRCYKLQEIPSEIGEIVTLRVIEVDGCSRSVVESARFILEEQESLGNDELQVRIHSDGELKTTNSTDVIFAESTVDINDLKEKYAMAAELGDSTSDTKMTSAAVQHVSNDTDSEMPPLMTISQLQEDEKSGQFWVYATISCLQSVGAWTYLACKLCFTELNPGKFFCDKCNSYDVGGRHRYNLTLKITDENGTAAFQLWDPEFLTLFAETDCVLNKAGQLEELPTEMYSLNDKKALFKVLVEEGQSKDFTGAYTVTEVISDPNEIKRYCERYSDPLVFEG